MQDGHLNCKRRIIRPAWILCDPDNLFSKMKSDSKFRFYFLLRDKFWSRTVQKVGKVEILWHSIKYTFLKMFFGTKVTVDVSVRFNSNLVLRSTQVEAMRRSEETASEII